MQTVCVEPLVAFITLDTVGSEDRFGTGATGPFQSPGSWVGFDPSKDQKNAETMGVFVV